MNTYPEVHRIEVSAENLERLTQCIKEEASVIKALERFAVESESSILNMPAQYFITTWGRFADRISQDLPPWSEGNSITFEPR